MHTDQCCQTAYCGRGKDVVQAEVLYKCLEPYGSIYTLEQLIVAAKKRNDEEQTRLQGLRHRSAVTRTAGRRILCGVLHRRARRRCVTEIQFHLPDTFPSQQLAIAAATQAGRQKIDVGFERGAMIGNGERRKNEDQLT